MVSSIQNNPLSSSMYWLSYGIPFTVPSIGSGGKWDGSKWIQSDTSDEEDNIYTPSYSSGNTSSPAPSSSFSGSFGSNRGGVNGYGFAAPGFAGAFNDEAVAGISQQGALSGMGSALGSSLGRSALGGAIAGGITGSIGTGISTAVAGLANPGTMAGIAAGAINGALGFEPGIATAAMAGLASLASPGLGMAIGMFGPAITDATMDAFDARENEFSRDWAEDLAGSYLGGRVAGKSLSDAINNRGMQPSWSSLANTMTNALGTLGIENIGLTQEALANAYADLGYTADVANVSAYADIVGMGIDSIADPGFGVGFGTEQAGPSSLGNPTGSFSMSSYMDAALADTYAGLAAPSMGTTAQSPSPAGQAIGQGVSAQAETASKADQGSPQGSPAGTEGQGQDTGQGQGDQGDSQGNDSNDSSGGGEGSNGAGGMGADGTSDSSSEGEDSSSDSDSDGDD